MNNNTNKRAAPRQFAISKFADTYDTGIEREDATWNDLVTKLAENPPEAATKEGLHLLKLAKFGDTINPNGSALRHNANVEFLSGIVAEHDAGTVSFEEAVTRLKAAGSDGVAAFIYQSPSHMKDGKGPRWRVLAPLSVDTDPAQHGPLMDKLNGVLGGALAPESWTLSQIYYYGRVTDREYYKPERIKGHHLDKLVGITPIGKGGGRLAEARVIRGIERDEEHEPSIEETELSKLVLGDGFTLDPDCSREEWLNAGMAMHEASAGANWGLAIFDAWSARGEKYAGDADTIGRWESFVDGKSGNVGIGFLKQHTRATVANFGPPLSAEQHARIDAEIAAARKGRPTIELRSGDLHHYVKRCEDVLARELFVLNQELVKIGATPDLIGLRDTDGVERDDKQLVIIPIGIEFIIRYLGEHVHFQKFDARSKEMVDKDCPRALAQNIAQGPEWPTMRPLRAIAAAPFLRADTTVCDAPGYDARSAVFYGPNGTFPPIPESPSQKDAAIALATLLAPFSEFPFAEPVHQAAFVAHILTEAVRPALDHAPLFCYTAPLAATGKSLLSGMPSRIVHGCAPALHTWTEDSDELRKVLFASLRVGDRTIGFDNLPNGGVVRAAELCKFITEEAHEGRVLGSSIVSKLPNKSVVFLTGNNITPAGDLARRSVVIRLDANTDSGGLRVRQFKIVDLARHIDANRGALLAAALTIVRAFVVAGSPKQGVIPLPSFERWSALVRDPLMWLGLADPASGQDDDTDDEQEPVGAAFAQMAARFAGRRFTSKELAVLCGVETETSGLRSALIEAGCAQPEDATELREWLRGVRLRVADGQKLVTWRTNANRGWQLVTVGRDRLQEDRDADVIG